MKKPLILAGIVLTLSTTAPVFADDNDCYVPMSQWQSRDTARSWAEGQGWDVRRIKIDDGCYEIKGYDQSGREIEVKIDPATLAIVDFEYEDDDDDNRKRKRGNNTRQNRPVTPPSNGLFTPGSASEVIVR